MLILGQSMTRAGVALLMAVVMPLSGVPHFDCVCPDGHRKPFCSGRSSPDTGCCCGDSCCASAQGGQCYSRVQAPSHAEPTGSGCCKHKTQRQPSPQTPAGGSQLQGGCCHLTPIQAEPPGVTTVGTMANPLPADGFSVPLQQADFAALVPSPGCGRFSGHCRGHPPPTDLVITLRHLTI